MTASEASHAMANIGMVLIFAPWIIGAAVLVAWYSVKRLWRAVRKERG